MPKTKFSFNTFSADVRNERILVFFSTVILQRTSQVTLNFNIQ